MGQQGIKCPLCGGKSPYKLHKTGKGSDGKWKMFYVGSYCIKCKVAYRRPVTFTTERVRL